MTKRFAVRNRLVSVLAVAIVFGMVPTDKAYAGAPSIGVPGKSYDMGHSDGIWTYNSPKGGSAFDDGTGEYHGYTFKGASVNVRPTGQDSGGVYSYPDGTRWNPNTGYLELSNGTVYDPTSSNGRIHDGPTGYDYYLSPDGKSILQCAPGQATQTNGCTEWTKGKNKFTKKGKSSPNKPPFASKGATAPTKAAVPPPTNNTKGAPNQYCEDLLVQINVVLPALEDSAETIELTKQLYTKYC